MLKLVIQISKGLVRDSRTRRWVMFYTVLAALLMLFIGATWLDGWLREHLLLFAGYWFACAWLTLLAVLLAFFDMLLVRSAGRRERRRLEERFLREEKGPPHDDENAA